MKSKLNTPMRSETFNVNIDKLCHLTSELFRPSHEEKSFLSKSIDTTKHQQFLSRLNDCMEIRKDKSKKKQQTSKEESSISLEVNDTNRIVRELEAMHQQAKDHLPLLDQVYARSNVAAFNLLESDYSTNATALLKNRKPKPTFLAQIVERKSLHGSVSFGSSQGLKRDQSKTLLASNINIKIDDCIYDILQSDPYNRSKSDERTLFNGLRHLKAFTKLSTFALSQLCSVMRYAKYEQNRIVFRQGTVGTSWFIILSGKVSVLVAQRGQLEHSKEIIQLSAGDSFGDLALINNEPRAASIATLTECHFIVVEKEDYVRVIKFLHEKEQQGRIYFLRKLDAFVNWSEKSLKGLASLCQSETETDTFLLLIDDHIPSFRFIVSGTCKVFRRIKTAQGNKNVCVGYYERGDYFGEEFLLRKSLVSSISVYAKGPVEFLSFTLSFAEERLKSIITLSPFLSMDDADIGRIHERQKEEAMIKKIQKTTLSRILIERYKDPHMNLDKFNKTAQFNKVWK